MGEQTIQIADIHSENISTTCNSRPIVIKFDIQFCRGDGYKHLKSAFIAGWLQSTSAHNALC